MASIISSFRVREKSGDGGEIRRRLAVLDKEIKRLGEEVKGFRKGKKGGVLRRVLLFIKFYLQKLRGIRGLGLLSL